MFHSCRADIVSKTTGLAKRLAQPFSKRTLPHAARVMGPTLVALTFAGVAHAQGTMDFSGAQTLMTTFNTRFAYVSVSRASHDAQIYTNNAVSLAETLNHDVTKASAIDFGKGQSPISDLGLEQATTTKTAPATSLGLA
jgi:hypothetical protein